MRAATREKNLPRPTREARIKGAGDMEMTPAVTVKIW
jgi:hypothetical protein